MNPPSEGIKDILVNAGLGLVSGQNLFIGKEPANPANTVTIFDTAGGGPMLTYNPEERYEYRAINIRVRHAWYDVGMKLAQDIYEALDGLTNLEFDGALYTRIRPIDSPALLGYDDNDRAWIVFNLELQRRPLPEMET